MNKMMCEQMADMAKEIKKLKAELAEKDKELKKLIEYNHRISRINNADGFILKEKVQSKIDELKAEGGMTSKDRIHWSNVIAVLKELLNGKEKE